MRCRTGAGTMLLGGSTGTGKYSIMSSGREGDSVRPAKADQTWLWRRSVE